VFYSNHLLFFSQVGGTDCNNLEPICTDVGISFTASSGVPDASTTSPGNNYDCLWSEPNPTYYYLEISTTGDVQMNLSASSDIDFIIWGPFSSLSDAEANCGSYSQVEDCSYSSTNNETPEITGAVAGEVYVMLVTNYANVVQDITLTQSGGTGNTDCTIVNPPEPVCPEYASASSSSTEICGSQLYYLNVPNIGCDGVIAFNVVGNYGSSFGSEITWEVVSNQTGNIVASGGPGTDGGIINTAVGPFDPATEGTVFNLIVYDTWGDGFNGTGGGIQIQSASGDILADISGNIGAQANQYFTSSMDISSATIEVTTPSGVVTNTMNNCQDFSVELTLENTSYCNPISIDLPWQITCDDGTFISSGTHSVTVSPQVPTQGNDVVSITWNAAACSWDISPNNDCDLLDIGSVFTISPDPASISPYCLDGIEGFTIDYLGLATGPNCCSTSGPLTPITYNTSIDQSSFIAATAYGGTNNSAYGVVSPNGIGGSATDVSIDVSGTGYCCPTCVQNPEPYYVDVYVDGVQVLFQGPLTVSDFSFSVSQADLMGSGVTYTQNSSVEIYVLPNTFYTIDPFTGLPLVYTTYIPGGNCGSLPEGQWSMGTFSASVSVVFEQQTTSPGVCSFIIDENYTCCSPAMVLPPDGASTVDCSLNIITPVAPLLMDNCGTEIIPLMSETPSPLCTGDKVYTYTYTDCAGITANWNYTYTVNDNIPPTASNPADINVPVAPAPSPDVSVITDALDNCSLNPLVMFVSDVSDGNSCPETITRTYSIMDDCGNETLVTQMVIINGAPVQEPSVIANGPICEGNSAVFTITGLADATVSYDTGSGPNSVVLTAGTATITIPGVNANTSIDLLSISDGSCTSALSLSATTEVILFSTPTFDPLGPYCQTGNVDVLPVSSIEGFAGTWNPTSIDNTVSGTSTYTFSPDPGQFVVQCISSSTMDITITDAPFVLAAALDSTLCEGDTTVLFIDSLSGGIPVEQFTMSFGSAFSHTTTNTNLPGNYYVVVSGTWSGSGACELRDPAYVMYQGCSNITPIPSYIWKWNGQSPTTQSTVPYVYNPNHSYSFFFEGGSGQTFSFSESNPNWYGDNSGSLTFEVYYLGGISWSTGATESSDTISPAVGTTTYSVTLDYGNGCVATDDVTINVDPLINPTFDQLGPFCQNNSNIINLPTSSNENIIGSWSPSTVDMTTSGITTYTFTSQTSQCALNTTMDILIEPAPGVGITNNSGTVVLTCTLLEIDLTATGGESYEWNSGLGTSSDVTINAPGIYSVTGYSAIGCESSVQIEITQDNEVDIYAALSVNEICTGESAIINVTSSNATSFEWVVVQNGVSGASAGSGVNTPSGLDINQVLSVTGTGTGTVEYTITPILGICSGEPQTITISINALTEPTFIQLGPYCVNDFITDNLNSLSDNGISGIWTPSIINVDIVGSTTYTYQPQEGECASESSMEIVVNALPEVSFSGDVLEGCAPLEVTLTSLSSGECLWTISNGDVLGGASASTMFTNSGCYDVTLTLEENGCSNSSTLIDYICIESNPIAEFSVFPQSFSDVNQIIDFTNNSQGATSYFWNLGDSNTSIDENPNHLYEETEEGIYVTLTAISEFGCLDSISVVIPFDEQEIFYIPNTFTPDGDNFNQVFNPIFYSGFDPYNFQMLIFNRWGEVIFETQNTEIGWDGSYSDQAGVVSDGMYTWKITYKNPKTDERKILIGHVLVLR
jgi:gliding motility-associated-like protein